MRPTRRRRPPVTPEPEFAGCEIEVLGSGTSVGVPTIGCHCRVCTSDDPRDRRLRPSVLIRFYDEETQRAVVIDTSPDFRQQALRAKLERVDAVIYTHDHADHIMGLDDIRPFNYGRPDRIPVYASPSTLRSLRRVFPYAFAGEGTHPGGVPRLEAKPVGTDPINLFGTVFQPVQVDHGPKEILGYRFGRAAYVTDQTGFPPESLAQLRDLDVLFLGALRHLPHPMHSTVEQALELVDILRPNRAFFTHVCHELSHKETIRQLPSGVSLAYDGLRIEVEG